MYPSSPMASVPLGILSVGHERHTFVGLTYLVKIWCQKFTVFARFLQLDEKKEKFFMLEEDFDKYQKHAELLANENISLKEERSNLLTQIHSGREKIFDLEEKVNVSKNLSHH